MDISAGTLQIHTVDYGPPPDANSNISSRVIDVSGLPGGFSVEHDIRLIKGGSAIKGYGLNGTQPHYVLHNLPTTLEDDFMDHLNQRAEFFDWNNSFAERVTDLTINNEGQTPLTVRLYRIMHDYMNVDEALFRLILTFSCWELHYTGHTQSEQAGSRAWCYKHRVIHEVTCGLDYI